MIKSFSKSPQEVNQSTPRVEEPPQDPGGIEIRGIHKSFSGSPILKGVSLTIQEGEFFSIIGPSGCGKTTLMKIISGLLYPDQGEVIIGGKNQTYAPPYLRDVNLVFQNYALFPHLNIFDNIAFGLKMKNISAAETAQRVHDALAIVRLSERAKSFPDELSGGQKQRIALARAMVNRPKVLLLDEPMAHLDLKMREAMREELSRLQKETKITFLMVTHDQEEALALSDHVAVMKDGSVLQTGRPQEVYESPKNSFVANFVGTSNILNGMVTGIKTDTPDGERLRVTLGGTEDFWIPNPDPRNSPTGKPIRFSIRPERIHITSQPADSFPNTLIGRVEEVSFLGFEIFYKVRVNHGADETIMVRTLYSPIKKIREKGERVVIQWRPEDATLLET